MTAEMEEGIAFTRDDLIAIRDTMRDLKNLNDNIDNRFKQTNDKIDMISQSIKGCQENCSGRRQKVTGEIQKLDGRLEIVENHHKEEGGILKGRKSDIAIVVGCASFFLMIITIWKVMTT